MVQSGDIVYWCQQDGHSYDVKFGIVDEVTAEYVYVDYLETKETRLVNGTPIDQFQSEATYRKLPKGWTYNTQLFTLTEDRQSLKDFDGVVTNNEDVKRAYESGLLVRAATKFHGVIEAEVTKEGYRIVKKYPMWQKATPLYERVNPKTCFHTYSEALAEVESYRQEQKRIHQLSDLDWSKEEIERVINRGPFTNEQKAHYKQVLFHMPNVEDLIVRLFESKLYWKYDKQSEWKPVTTG